MSRPIGTYLLIMLFSIGFFIPSNINADFNSDQEIFSITSENSLNNFELNIYEETIMGVSQYHKITLKEEFLINDQKNNENNNQKELKSYTMLLKEEIKIFDNKQLNNFFIIPNFNSFDVTTLEIIFKKSKIHRTQSQSITLDILSNNYLKNNFIENINPFLTTLSFQSFFSLFEIKQINLSENTSPTKFLDLQTNSKSIDFLSDEQYIGILFVIPIAGLALAYAENTRFKIKKIYSIPKYFLIFILLSTFVVNPLLISSSYWGIVYAEEFSF